MGKITFDPLQKIIVDEVKKDPYLSKQFYFTGGTALSIFYFHHRLSEDLDFFSETKFQKDKIIEFISELQSKYKFHATLRQPEGLDIFVYSLDFGKKGTLKVDFNVYPYQKIEKRKIVDTLVVDSLRDIGANKLITINQRTDVKDFVDLYFLLKKFTLWDLLYGVEAKFHMELEPFMVATDMLKVDDFQTLPKMLKPLTLTQLRNYFRTKAKELGKKVTIR